MEDMREMIQDLGVSVEDMKGIMKAVSQVYPMIVLVNLSKNTYVMINREDFLYNDVPSSGCYDDLVDDNVENIHSNYRYLFQECFSREHLIHSFEAGKTEAYAEVYQKNKKGQYQWVSTHAVRIPDREGDMCQICFNRVLDGIVQERHSSRK
jgi:hypothetical protein